MTNRPRPVRSILTQYQQHRISYESALSLLLSLGIAWNNAKYYLQATGYEYEWEVA
jgi:hypothetical protein